MKTFIRSLSLVMILFLFINATYAQSPRFQTYRALKSKQNVRVNDLLQDTLGYIWLGTNYGLIKFDGQSFSLLTTTDGLSDNAVSSLELDAENNLWIGHKSGNISKIEENVPGVFNPEEGLSAEEVSDIYFDKTNQLWFSTFGEGVYYYSGENRLRLYNLNTDDGLLDNYVYCIEEDKEGRLYFGTDKGIAIYNSKNKVFETSITMNTGLPDNLVKDLFIDGETLWIGMDEGGICNYNLDSESFGKIASWPFSAVHSFVNLSEKKIWVATQNDGIIECELIGNEINYSRFTREMGLASNRVNSLLVDREGNVWAGTNKGLSLRRNNRLEFLNEIDDFSIKNVFSFTIDNQQNYWFASDQGLFLGKKNKMGYIAIEKVFDDPAFANYSFISLYTDHEGYIWAGTYGFGLYRINPEDLSAIHLTKSKGLANDNVIHITGDNQSLWVSTLGGGISKISLQDLANIKNYTAASGLPSDYVYSIFIASNNEKWVASDGGGVTQIINDEIIEKDGMDNLSNSAIVYGVVEDTLGTIWLNFADQGIFHYRDSCSLYFDEDNGLSTNNISALILDSDNSLLAVSNEGLNWLNNDKQLFAHLGETDGVYNLKPNLNAVYKDNEHNIWIGTGQGMVKISNANKTDADLKPKLFISSKQVFNKRLGSYQDINPDLSRFSYSENHFLFKFQSIWFKSGSDHLYRYRLVGYDLDWNAETNTQIATYSNLPPGKYSFEVQVKHDNKNWESTALAIYAFEIKPPFWRQPWFIIGFIALLVFFVLTYIRYRTKSLEEAKEILEIEVKKRTKEIRQQRDEIEAQKNEIEAQRDFVTEQRDQIEKQNQSITSSIQYASRIQTAVLPPCDLFEDNLSDYFIFFRPRDIVSGDFYYINQMGNKTVVAAADCTGHGVPGALMSILGIAQLNQIMSGVKDNLSASDILNSLREAIKSSLRQTGKSDEAKDGMDIALCILDRDKQEVEFSGAYNPLLLVRNGELTQYKGDRMPIGIFSYGEDSFSNQVVKLEKGDMIYLYSDGFQDQFGGPEGRKFLPKKLKNLLIENAEKTLKDQEEALDHALKAWMGSLPQVDDILVVGIRI